MEAKALLCVLFRHKSLLILAIFKNFVIKLRFVP